MPKTSGRISEKGGQMKRNYKFIKTLVFLTALFLLVRPVYAEAEKQLPIKLLATVIEPDPAKSTCIILNSETKTQANYKALDTVCGYQIVKITRGSIKLLRDGKLYTLDFPFGNENKGVSSDAITINRQEILKKISIPSVLLTQGLPQPYVEAGKILGFKVPAIKDKSLLQMAGLAEGDIATKVNGEKLDSIPKAIEVYSRVKNQERVNLEIRRGDIVKTLTYFIN